MRRFYFDVDDGSGITRDDVGIELLSLKAARAEAIRALPAMAHDELPDGANHNFTVSVRNMNGDVIFRASLNFRTDFISQDLFDAM